MTKLKVQMKSKCQTLRPSFDYPEIRFGRTDRKFGEAIIAFVKTLERNEVNQPSY